MSEETPRQAYGTPTEVQSQQGTQTAVDTELYSIQPQLPALAAELPTGGLCKFACSTAFEQILAALYRDGAVILLNAVTEEVTDRCKTELEPYLSE